MPHLAIEINCDKETCGNCTQRKLSRLNKSPCWICNIFETFLYDDIPGEFTRLERCKEKEIRGSFYTEKRFLEIPKDSKNYVP